MLRGFVANGLELSRYLLASNADFNHFPYDHQYLDRIVRRC
jgi:hypothetical protein